MEERKRIGAKSKKKVMASKNRKFRPQKDGRAATFRRVKSPVNYVVDNKKLSWKKKTLVIVQRQSCF